MTHVSLHSGTITNKLVTQPIAQAPQLTLPHSLTLLVSLCHSETIGVAQASNGATRRRYARYPPPTTHTPLAHHHISSLISFPPRASLPVSRGGLLLFY